MTAPNREDRLQQYFDGELTGEAAEVVRRELDDEQRAELEGLEHLRTLLRAGAEEASADLDADALFASIEARLDEDDREDADDDPLFPRPVADEPAEARPARPQLAVVAGGKADAPAPAEPPGADGSHTGLWIGAVATGLAAAAALILWMTRPADDVGSVEDPGATPDPGATVAEAAPPPGSEVEEVDFGYSTGAVFSVEGNEGEQYAVVWISDEKVPVDDEPEERIQ
jgi:hypothetical protein